MSDVYRLLTERLTRHLSDPSVSIGPASTFVQLGLDSLALVELSVELSDALDIDVEGLGPDSTVQEAVELISARQAEASTQLEIS